MDKVSYGAKNNGHAAFLAERWPPVAIEHAQAV